MSENKISGATSKTAAEITLSRTKRFLFADTHQLGTQLELAALLCRGHIDAGRLQPPLVLRPQLGTDDMKGLPAALESFFDEGKKHAILLIGVVEERAHVTLRAKH